MSSEFMRNFLSGWQVGQDRIEQQRRDEAMARQAEQEQYQREQDRIANEMRREHWNLQKKQADLEMKRAEFDAKTQAAALMSRNQLPAQVEDLGGATPEAPSAGVLQMAPYGERAPITAEIPGAPEAGPVTLPFKEDIEEQKALESQRKMREALGLHEAEAAITARYREPKKTLGEIRAEARARAEGSLAAGASGEGETPGYLDATAQGLANYEIGLGDLGRMGKGEKAMAFALAKKMNPSFNASLYKSRQALRTDFTSGKTANNIDSLNTAVDHINTLAEYTKALKNGNMPFANQIAQTFATATGNPAATNYKTMATAVESEIASLLKKTGATDQEINSWRANFSAAGSPAQLQGSINTVLKVMRGREQALQQRWKTGMGTGQQYPIYGEEQQAILNALGYSGGGAAPGGEEWQTVAGVRVRKKNR